MTYQDILAFVGQAIRDLGGSRVREVLPQHLLGSAELNLDSVDHVELVMTVEYHFGIQISDEDAEEMVTVDDLVTYIDQVLTGRRAK